MQGQMAEPPVTRWLILGVPGDPVGLGVVLVADTVAPLVVEAIERAARENGVELRRLEDGA